jgi:hypothetical protein
MSFDIDVNNVIVILALFILILILIRVDRRVQSLDGRVHSLDGRMSQIQEEVRYDIPPARRITIENAILIVLRGRRKGMGQEAGVAFFVSPTTALTVAHNLPKGARTVVCVRNTDKARFVFNITHSEKELDFAVLQLAPDQPAVQHFLTIPEHVNTVAGEKGIVLVTCNIRPAKEAPEATTVGVAWQPAAVVRMDHPRHFVFYSQTFDGDSGGAIVVGRTGAVIGLHQLLVNQAEELVNHKLDVGERLNAVERSVKSLISGNALGCVGLRVDAAEVRAALGGLSR